MSILDLDGTYATDVRPPRKPDGRKLWAKDPSAPGANDGTRLDATTINDLIGMFRALMAAAGINPPAGDDSALVNAIVSLVAGLPPAEHTHLIADMQDGGGFVRMTDAERAKLASLAANYKGAFADLAAVAAAYPAAAAGDWAIIMKPGEPAAVAVWDADTEEWVESGGSPPQTASQVPFTPSGNLSATNVQAALEELDSEKEPALGFTPVPNTRKVEGAGLAQGGGALSADRTITVPKAEAADMRAGTNDDKALTTKAAYDASAEVQLEYADPLVINFSLGTNFKVVLEGSPEIQATGLDNVDGKMGRIRFIQDQTGNREPTWDSKFVFAGGEAPEFSSSGGAEDRAYYDICDGKVYIALSGDIK